MNKKTKRSLSIALDVLLVIMIALILFISINGIVSKNKGYTSLFGKVVYAVETDSMKGNYKDSFDKNSLIFCRELKTEAEKKAVKTGDVITFWFMKNGQRALNTHRVIGVMDAEGANRQYVTKGDNVAQEDAGSVVWSDVVAVYESKISGIGAVVLFAQSSAGFFVVAVIPSILLFGYCIILFYSSFKKAYGKKQLAGATLEELDLSDEQKAELKAELKRQLLAELSGESTPAQTEAKPQPEPQPEPEAKVEEVKAEVKAETEEVKAEAKAETEEVKAEVEAETEKKKPAKAKVEKAPKQ